MAHNPTPQEISVAQVRLIADLRIMHSKTSELYSTINMIRRRHTEADVVSCGDQNALKDDIGKMEQCYGWFLKIKSEVNGLNEPPSSGQAVSSTS